MENKTETIILSSDDDNAPEGDNPVLCDYPKRGIPGSLAISYKDFLTLNPEVFLNDSIIGICL